MHPVKGISSNFLDLGRRPLIYSEPSHTYCYVHCISLQPLTVVTLSLCYAMVYTNFCPLTLSCLIKSEPSSTFSSPLPTFIGCGFSFFSASKPLTFEHEFLDELIIWSNSISSLNFVSSLLKRLTQGTYSPTEYVCLTSERSRQRLG